MEKPKVIIVDDNDVPIGLKYRQEMDPEKDNYRCSGIWITNNKAEVLLAQRKFTKTHDPGKWGPAAAGTLEEGDTYESNAYQELSEELGITGITLTVGPAQRVLTPHRFFCRWYFCEITKDAAEFAIQEDEVEQVLWIGEEELRADVAKNPQNYIASFPEAIELLLQP